jgi:glutamate racemase
LVFDSGVGGLTIAEAITGHLPHCSIIYGSDNAAFPYGIKKESQLIDRVDAVLHKFQSVSQADIIVVACNTASTVALPKIRERFDLPIVGVVPAIKPAAQISQTKTIGLLATVGTINRDYTHTLIEEFASDCQVISIGSNELVTLAEHKLRDENPSFENLPKILRPFKDTEGLDTIVLACTHFPLLTDELQNMLPEVENWIDSGKAIARRVEYWLKELGLPITADSSPDHSGLFTANQPEIAQLMPALYRRSISQIDFISVN